MQTVQAVLKCKHCGKEETRTLRLPDDVSTIPNTFECVNCCEGRRAFDHVKNIEAYERLTKRQREELDKIRKNTQYKYLRWIEKNYPKPHVYPRIKQHVHRQNRRARMHNAPGVFDYDKWMERVKYYGWKCVYCGVRLTEQTLTIDHYIPLSKGGSNWPSNLYPACLHCNCSKCAKLGWTIRKRSNG